MSKYEEPTYFPQYLDAQIQVLSFEADEVIVFVLLLVFASKGGKFFGIDLHTLCTYAMLVLMPYYYRKTKVKYPNGYIKHLLHISGIRTYKFYPNPFINVFYE